MKPSEPKTEKPVPNTYCGEQYDDVEKLFDDAERLLSSPSTRKEGRDLLALVKAKIDRERNRLVYAKLTNQQPHIPPLEPSALKVLRDKNA